MFDFGTWVVTLLAESSRKKLFSLVLGSEHERALRSAATEAVRLTAQEIHPSNEEEADQLALVIDQVFSSPVPDDQLGEHWTLLEAFRVGIHGQLAVLDDAALTGQDQSSADILGVSGAVLAEKLLAHLERELIVRGARGGPLTALVGQLNHDVTHLQVRQTHQAVLEIADAVRANSERSSGGGPPVLPSPPTTITDVALHVEQLLEGLDIGEHDEAERRVNRLFLPLLRAQQRAVIEALIRTATATNDDTTQLVACSLLEAANRLDPTLVTVEEVEGLARSDNFSLRSSSAVLMWEWAISFPGRVPVPLLGRLTRPSREDWYVHAAARAGAKQLLLTRRTARAIFDRMAASQDGDDRSYAAADLLEVARVDPRVVPIDLARRLAHDHDKAVAKRGVELLRLLEGLKPSERMRVHGMFGI